MSDPREALVQAMLGYDANGCTEVPTARGWAEHVANSVLAEFLVVPLSDIVGTEYGYRFKEPKYSERTQSTGSWRDEAIEVVAYLRNEQTRLGHDLNAEALSRPLLRWSPIPLGDVSDGE